MKNLNTLLIVSLVTGLASPVLATDMDKKQVSTDISVASTSTGFVANRVAGYRVDLRDTYGDGWNGGMLDVIVNGTLVYDNITLPSGAGPLSFPLDLNVGDAIVADFTAGGWCYECVFAFYDPTNALIIQSVSPGGSTCPPDLSFTLTGPCVDSGCPAGYDAAFEAEGNGLDTNGGCNSDPVAIEVLALDTPLCGTTWANAGTRDTDWFEVALTGSSTISATVQANCVPMAVIIADQTCPNPVIYSSLAIPAGTSGTLVSGCLPEGTYRVIVLPNLFDGYAAEGLHHYGLNVTLDESCLLPCEDFTCTPIDGSGSYFGDTTGHVNIAGNSAPDDYYCFTATDDCVAIFSTCSVNTLFVPSNDTYLRLWSAGGPCGGGVQLATDDDGCDGLNGTPGYASVLTYSLVAGQSYVLQVEGYGSNAGVYELIVDSPCLTVEAYETPMAFALNQNVPNPFNPSTTIAYTTSETGFASLKVFDLAGATVATLVNGVVEAGSHSITFDASNLTSGVYFYTLEANGTVETKKMVLMK